MRTFNNILRFLFHRLHLTHILPEGVFTMYFEAWKRYLWQRQRMFFLFPTGSHITKEDGMSREKFSYAKWGTNEFKSGKYSDRSSRRLEIPIFLINKESFFLLSLNTSTTVTKVETHNDCTVRLWHILSHILQRNYSVFSFHSCWLDQEFTIQRTHSCFTTF